MFCRAWLHREPEPAADCLGDVSKGDALLTHCMIRLLGRSTFKRKAEEPRGTFNVHRRPAGGAVADLGGHASFTRDVHQHGDEAVLLANAMDRRRQPHGRCVHPAVRQHAGRFFGRRG